MIPLCIIPAHSLPGNDTLDMAALLMNHQGVIFRGAMGKPRVVLMMHGHLSHMGAVHGNCWVKHINPSDEDSDLDGVKTSFWSASKLSWLEPLSRRCCPVTCVNIVSAACLVNCGVQHLL